MATRLCLECIGPNVTPWCGDALWGLESFSSPLMENSPLPPCLHQEWKRAGWQWEETCWILHGPGDLASLSAAPISVH